MSLATVSKVLQGCWLSRAAFSFHCRNVFCIVASWHNQLDRMLSLFEPCVYVWVCFILGMLLFSGCPLAGLSMMLLQPWRLCVSAPFMLSQHPTGCATAVCYLPSLSNHLNLSLCDVQSKLCSWPNTDQSPVDLCQHKARPFFPPTCPWGKILDSACISMPHIPHWYASSVKYVHLA